MIPVLGRASRVRLVALFLGGTSAACALDGAYDRTNPFDPGAHVEITPVGPESTHSIGERFTVTLESNLPWPPGPLAITWAGDTSRRLTSLGDGLFEVEDASAAYRQTFAIAWFRDRPYGKRVFVGQRFTTFSLWCGPAAGPAVACDAAPRAIGSAILLRSIMLDPAGYPMDSLIVLPVLRASRDTLVARPSAAATVPGTFGFTAVGAGAVWLIVTVAGLTDSVRVVVGP